MTQIKIKVYTVDFDNRENLHKRFIANRHTGLLILAGIIASKFVS